MDARKIINFILAEKTQASKLEGNNGCMCGRVVYGTKVNVVL